MNSTVYLFGELHNGYTQYPNDYTSDIFKSFYDNAKSTTQVAIHRDGDLMYYAYVRKLDQNQYVGFCVLVNGLYLTRIDGLFDLFEHTIETMATNGCIIHFNELGELCSDVNQLYVDPEQIRLITEKLQKGFLRFENHAAALPAVDYGTSKNSVQNYTIDNDASTIISASIQYGNTYIYKQSDYQSANFNSYRSVLKRTSKENAELKQKNSELNSLLTKEKAKQKSLAGISVLGFIVFILVVVLWQKVWFPTEVTKKYMTEFVYYGPIENNKPHGKGVAFYYDNDVDGRKFYAGNFYYGKRQDDNAMLYYKNGNYFYGKMQNDTLVSGIQYNSDKSLFEGTIKNNEPWDGTWYYYKKAYDIENGKKKTKKQENSTYTVIPFLSNFH